MINAARAILNQAPVVPVITIHDPETAVPLADALVKGGIVVLEITLRTDAGLESIRRIKAEVSGAIVGVGTVANTRDLENALAAGSEFVITPGITPTLLSNGARCGVPFMPGIATVSELMTCLEEGLDTLKFFPAEASGGANALKALGGPFPDVRFCPTGGIGLHNLADYLRVPSVLSVGGSWLVPEELISAGHWDGITRLAEQACERVRAIRAGQSTSG